jgi:hypothetical protein
LGILDWGIIDDSAALNKSSLNRQSTITNRQRINDQRSAMIADWRQAFRSLRRSPTFATTAIATLSFGIGATSAIFTIVNAALFKPLPYPNPEELVVLATLRCVRPQGSCFYSCAIEFCHGLRRRKALRAD